MTFNDLKKTHDIVFLKWNAKKKTLPIRIIFQRILFAYKVKEFQLTTRVNFVCLVINTITRSKRFQKHVSLKANNFRCKQN